VTLFRSAVPRLGECFLRLAITNCVGHGVKRPLDWRRLKPEEKVNMAVDMTDAAVRVCAEGARAEHPGMTEEELIERLRERFAWMKRWRRRGV